MRGQCQARIDTMLYAITIALSLLAATVPPLTEPQAKQLTTARDNVDRLDEPATLHADQPRPDYGITAVGCD